MAASGSNEASAQAFEVYDGYFDVLPDPPAPGTPTNLQAFGADQKITLTWSASANTQRYFVYRSLSENGQYAGIGQVTTPGFTNNGLTNGTRYWYYVKALNAVDVESNPSNKASAIPNVTFGTAPSDLTATPGNQKVTLTWSALSGAVSYTVQRSLTSGGPYTIVQNGVTATNYVNTGLTNGTKYFYVVSAKNAANETSPNSNEASATPRYLSVPIEIQPTPALGYLPDPMTFPDWMAGVEPSDTSEAADGPSGALSVNLSHGVVKFDSGPDLVVPNPKGPDIVFERLYRTAMAAGGFSSPGLASGWSHNWDYRIISSSATAWAPLRLVYPNGASETITPVMSGGAPTGNFTVASGASYYVTGVPSYVTGVWTNITVANDSAQRTVFTLAPGDAMYRLKTKFFSNGTQVNLTYSSARLTSIDNGGTTPSNLQINFTYSGNLLSQISDPNGGRSRSFSYNAGLLTSVSRINSLSSSWTYQYESLQGVSYLKVVSTIDAHNRPTSATVSYDTATGRATGRSDGTGNTRSTVFEDQGLTTVTVRDSSNVVTDTYAAKSDSMGRQISAKNAANDLTSWTYSATQPSVPDRITRPGKADMTIDTDVKGNVTQTKYPFGNKILYTWEYPPEAPLGRIKIITEQGIDGVTISPTVYTYYAVNEVGGLPNYLKSITRSDGVTTTYTYTSLGNLKTVSDPYVTTFEYEVRDGNGNLTHGELFGRPYVARNPLNQISQRRYDSLGRLSTNTGPLLDTNTITYNAYDQIVNVVTAGGYQTQVNYAVPGHAPTSTTLIKDGAPIVTSTAGYDSQSQATRGTDPLGRNVDAVFDGRSNLTSVKNGSGQTVHRFTINPAGRSMVTQFGSGSRSLTETATASPAGSLRTITRSNGRSTDIFGWGNDPDYISSITTSDPATGQQTKMECWRDSFGRPVDVWQTAGDGLTVDQSSYTYDSAGRLSVVSTYNWKVNPSNGVRTYAMDQRTTINSFNADGTRLSMQYSCGSGSAAVSILYTYEYDALRRVKKVTAATTSPGLNNTVTASYTYDAIGRVVAVRTPQATTLYSYNALSQVVGIQNLTADGTVEPFSSSDMRVTDPYNGSAHSVISSFYDITYDVLGNRNSMKFVALTQTGTSANTSVYGSGTAEWTFDAAGRLISESWTGTGVPNVIYSHSYDNGDNLVSLRNQAHTIDALSDTLTGATGGGTLAYNSSGELTGYRGLTSTYDPDGRMVKVAGSAIDPATSASSAFQTDMRYDHTGRRSSVKTTLLSGAATTAYFDYDGPLLISRLLNTTTVDRAVQTDLGTDFGRVFYLWGPTGPVVEFNAISSRTLLFDPQGSCVSTCGGVPASGVSLSGTPAFPVFYDAYGRPVWAPPAPSGSGTIPFNRTTSQPFQYKGQYGHYSDGLSDLNYCLNRYYDPILGRWTSRDPAGLKGGVNVYSYCQGNPLMLADPDGLQGMQGPDIGSQILQFLGFRSPEEYWSSAHKYVMENEDNFYGDQYRLYAAIFENNPKLMAVSAMKMGLHVLTAAELNASFGCLSFPKLAVQDEVCMVITRRLSNLASKAAREFEANPLRFSPAQSKAIAKYPRLEAAFKGDRIDAILKRMVESDRLLNYYNLKVTPRGVRGPDFFFKDKGVWWDLTTEKAWAAHLKYTKDFGKGTRIGY